MKTNLLPAATAVIALTMGSAMAAPPMAAFQGTRANPVVRHSPGKRVLYNQNSDSSYAYVNSQNYTSGVTADDDQAADDFIVPSGKTWKVTEIDVTGCCSGTSSITENVTFAKDNKGVPGRLVKSFVNLSGTGNPSFAISLGKGALLKAGHYWVSVVVNCNSGDGCGWGWGVRSTIANDPALWKNPGNGRDTGCTTWTTLETCFGSAYAGDFMFELQGKSK